LSFGLDLGQRKDELETCARRPHELHKRRRSSRGSLEGQERFVLVVVVAKHRLKGVHDPGAICILALLGAARGRRDFALAAAHAAKTHATDRGRVSTQAQLINGFPPLQKLSFVRFG
jgi:hypothetical protein